MNGNKAITKRDIDFAKWYTDVVTAAKLARYKEEAEAETKGMLELYKNSQV